MKKIRPAAPVVAKRSPDVESHYKVLEIPGPQAHKDSPGCLNLISYLSVSLRILFHLFLTALIKLVPKLSSANSTPCFNSVSILREWHGACALVYISDLHKGKRW